MAARANDPVLFLEHKGLYRRPQAKSQEPDAEYLVPFGRGRVRREGRDITWSDHARFDDAVKVVDLGLSSEVGTVAARESGAAIDYRGAMVPGKGALNNLRALENGSDRVFANEAVRREPPITQAL